ncbi:MAG: glycoside hydrolase family 43 protein [Oscillospiraceae bacterium]|jgi:arabinan endo-1,5-alpha-L-arabinosidase|nr:glycoside hydrolase family 43 protein [Oscillospiraceae bacterium]
MTRVLARASALILSILLILLMGIASSESIEPSFTDAYVHDPSILYADGWYYIYGSHMAAAKSRDLMNWTMISYNAQDGCTLVDDVRNQMADALTWARTNTFWAPSVERLADGRCYMYYCTCEGSSPLSAMGLAVSDNPEGPFVDRGVFLRSGMMGASEDGTAYNATIHPNVIDPHVFHDNDGQLWMVYGSYSGGIFILKMDESTGLPLPGQGYGKKLLGKNHSRIEGPYILYAPETDYYYLFLSFGGLEASDGYNIRVARSKSPDGPYIDARGQDMIDCGGPDGSYFNDKAIEPYGVKLVGGFRFMPLDGVEPLPQQAYKSPGHNSAYRHPDTGDYFLIFHTRFSALGDEFRDRAHQFWFNDEGWPIVSPLRFAGEAPTPNISFDGEWRVVLHGGDINKTQHRSIVVQFDNDGTVSGDTSGEWSADSVTLSGVRYQGLFASGWDMERNAWVPVFTGLSDSGEALWGMQ